MTPQFHVVYDDWFSTTAPDGDVDYSKFQDLLLAPNARYCTPLDDDFSPELIDEWLTGTEKETRDAYRQQLVTGHVSPVAPLERERSQGQGHQEQPSSSPTRVPS